MQIVSFKVNIPSSKHLTAMKEAVQVSTTHVEGMCAHRPEQTSLTIKHAFLQQEHGSCSRFLVKLIEFYTEKSCLRFEKT